MGDLQKAHRLAEIQTLLKSKMEEYGITRDQLAQQFDDPTKAIHNISLWLQGRGAPGARYVYRLAEILDVEPEDLSLFPKSKALTVIAAQEKQVTFTVSGDFDGEISISFRKDK